MDKIEHEEIGTLAGIEISQDTDNTRPKSKMVSKSLSNINAFVRSIRYS